MSTGRVLHVLSQRPLLTGSGVTLDAYLRCAERRGWRQAAVVGIPDDVATPAVGGLPADALFPLRFGAGALDFPVPGMSDIMPYRSSVFSCLAADQLDRYRAAWRAHLERVIAQVRPDLIHSHHVWLMSALIKEVAPDLPVVTSCHATGLRQMKLCPHLADEARRGCARNDRFVALTPEHAAALAAELDIPRDRIVVARPGYRADLFTDKDRPAERGGNRICYVGKYSEAKGLPRLLDAFELLLHDRPDLELHVAGGGDSDEANRLRARMTRLAPAVTLHGQLDQPALAGLLRRCDLLALPSFYEGVPLVLVEGRACGCRLLATDLPGIRGELLPTLGDDLRLVPPPPMLGVDRPAPAGLPAFTQALADGLRAGLALGPPAPRGETLARRLRPFAWETVFGEVEKVWRDLLRRPAG